jgi:hypothetical protein
MTAGTDIPARARTAQGTPPMITNTFSAYSMNKLRVA